VAALGCKTTQGDKVEGEGDAKVEEAAKLPTPPQPAVPLEVLYDEENMGALNDWAFAFADWERVGEFRLGMQIDEVVAKLGEPEELESQSEWYGSEVDYYGYPSKGYGFHVERLVEELEGQVISISVRAPAADKTRLGIAVGAHAEEVEEVYGPYVNWSVSGETNLSAGFMYSWVQFQLADGFVDEIHIGTGDPFESMGDGED
jgi:hypothetical protein